MIKKIISGGQTGADQGGLEAGKILGIETGGTCPFGWKTERGNERILLEEFGLIPNLSTKYSDRTRENVVNSNGTVIFGNTNSPGSKITLELCKKLNKPCLFGKFEHDYFLEWIEENGIEILNVAGNRESKLPKIQATVKEYLVTALKI